MKRRFTWLIITVAYATAAGPAAAQISASQPLDARGSDPAVMQWMVGAPPPQDKLIAFADGSWFKFPQTRWSFSNVRQLVPTRTVERGNDAAGRPF